MKHLMVGLFAAFVGLGMLGQDAEARRLGGGKSFGMQRDAQVMKRDATPPTAPTQGATTPTQGTAPAAGTPAPAQPSGASRWLGPLAGLAIGAGLASLFAGTPFGGFLGALAIGLLVFFCVMLLLRVLRRPQADPPLQYAGTGASAHSAPMTGQATPIGRAGETRRANIPADFDVENFLRQAKLNFLRLQAANDSGNVEDIRNFTTPEVFAELRLQLTERGAGQQSTDVVTLNAEVLDVSTQDQRYVASVRFFGSVREQEGAQPEAFDEVWHLSKPVEGGSGWVIAGIQQFELNA